MIDGDDVMNPLHFGSDPADIRIRIRKSGFQSLIYFDYIQNLYYILNFIQLCGYVDLLHVAKPRDTLGTTSHRLSGARR